MQGLALVAYDLVVKMVAVLAAMLTVGSVYSNLLHVLSDHGRSLFEKEEQRNLRIAVFVAIAIGTAYGVTGDSRFILTLVLGAMALYMAVGEYEIDVGGTTQKVTDFVLSLFNFSAL